MEAIPIPPGFDFKNQSVTIFQDGHDGTMSTVNIAMASIDDSTLLGIRCTALYSFEMTACLFMLLLVAFLTKPAKRWSLIFWLNESTLLLGFVRGLLLFLWFEGSTNRFYTVFTQDAPSIPTIETVTQVGLTVIVFLFSTFIFCSLGLQAWTISKTMNRKWHVSLCAVSSIILLVSVGSHFFLMVMNSKSIVGATVFNYDWASTFTRAMECISLFWFSAIFGSKLWAAIATRKSMGLAHWHHFHVLAIMAGCTMIVPAIFSIAWWAGADVLVNGFPSSDSLTLTLAAILLPISSLWAASVIQNNSQQRSINLVDILQPSRASVCTKCDATTTGTTTATNSTAVASRRNDSLTPLTAVSRRNDSLTPLTTVSPATTSATAAQRDPLEDDMLAMGVRVDRTYSIRSEKRE